MILIFKKIIENDFYDKNALEINFSIILHCI